MASIPRFIPLARSWPYVCQQCIRSQRNVSRALHHTSTATTDPDKSAQWKQQVKRIKSGEQKSMLAVLEERGFVKDFAGGREALDWLLTKKPIGAYVGVDPTAPSLHVGHLLPLMALYWMHLHGYYTVTLLGGGTVQIGDPSGRTTSRARQTARKQLMHTVSIQQQLKQLWVNVKELGIKHRYSLDTREQRDVLNNLDWLKNLTAVDLMKSLGSGMNLRTMLNRDSVKMRMESGDGMAISEFCYPLFQGYDWWHMYSTRGVQLQIGGSDQYGNICAGMDAVDHMRRYEQREAETTVKEDTLNNTFGLTTPLLTTASGEKFGKSAGNAVWLDQNMLSSFDLYQYFLRTSDDDVERYLKLFTFLPLDSIYLVMAQQRKDASKRVAQHLLAKEVVELAHGTIAAKEAEAAHKEAFGHGTNIYSLSALRRTLQSDSSSRSGENSNQRSPHVIQETRIGPEVTTNDMIKYKRRYAASSGTPNTAASVEEDTTIADRIAKVLILPDSLLQKGTFPHVLCAAGLASSKSEAHRLIKSKGAYVVLPHSGTAENPYGLKWEPIPSSVQNEDPKHYLIDFEALVLRSGKTKIQVCRIIDEKSFDEQKLSVPGWADFKAKRAENVS